VSVLLKELYPVTEQNLICSKCNTVFIRPGMLQNHVCSRTETPIIANNDQAVQIAEMRSEIKELKDVITSLVNLIKGASLPFQTSVDQGDVALSNTQQPSMSHTKTGKIREKKSAKTLMTNAIKKTVQMDSQMKPLYSPDTSLENVEELLDRMKAVRSVKDISDLVVSRCEDIYFKNPVNRSFQVLSEGQASFFDTIDSRWKDTTLTHKSKEMTEFATEDFINKIEDFSMNLSIESMAAWEKVDEMYDDKRSHFFRSTSEKIVNILLYPEMEKEIPT